MSVGLCSVDAIRRVKGGRKRGGTRRGERKPDPATDTGTGQQGRTVLYSPQTNSLVHLNFKASVRRDFGAKHRKSCECTSLSRVSGRRAARGAISVKRTEGAPLVPLPPRTYPRHLTSMAGHNRAFLTPPQSGAIREMASMGSSNGPIAATLRLKKSTVAHVAKKARGGAGVVKADGRGRRRLLSERDIGGLGRLVNADRFSRLTAISALVSASRDSAFSGRSVRRAMEELGVTSMAPAVEPWVSDANKVKRVAWARLHKDWKEEWPTPLSTDKSSFRGAPPRSRSSLPNLGRSLSTLLPAPVS